MLQFSVFITEMAAASSAVLSDDKGKLHELLLARHLHPQGILPSHHRAESENEEHSGTPEQVHDRLRKKVGEPAFNEINGHAQQTAAGIIKHLKDHGHIGSNGHDISEVHWTSNRDTLKKAGDHEKTTGVKDINSNADLILTTRDKKNSQHKNYIGISAKYGTESEPNFKNPGLDALEKEAGHSPGTYVKLKAAHDDAVKKLGYEGSAQDRHKQWKLDKEELRREETEHKKKYGKDRPFLPKGKRAKMAFEAEQSSLEMRKKITRMHEDAIGKKSDSEMREHIRSNVSPPTRFEHIVAHSHVQSNGTAVSKIKNARDIADEHLKNYTDLRIRKGNGISADIVGKGPDGKEVVVARHTIKNVSGPQKGVAGTFKLEGSGRHEEKPEKKKVSDMKPKTKPDTKKTPIQKAPAKKKNVKSFKDHVSKEPDAEGRWADDGGKVGNDGTHGGAKW